MQDLPQYRAGRQHFLIRCRHPGPRTERFAGIGSPSSSPRQADSRTESCLRGMGSETVKQRSIAPVEVPERDGHVPGADDGHRYRRQRRFRRLVAPQACGKLCIVFIPILDFDSFTLLGGSFGHLGGFWGFGTVGPSGLWWI